MFAGTQRHPEPRVRLGWGQRMSGAARIGAGLGLGWGLGLAASCGVSSFTCESDQACQGLADAQCEPSGFCSQPDPDCLGSGRRYAPHSGALSGQCVSEGETVTGSTTSTDDALASTGSSTGPDPSVGTTLPLDGSSTSGPPLDGSSTSGSPPDSSTSGEDPTGSEPPPGVACRGPALVEEPFASLPLDPLVWSSYEGQGVTVELFAGELRFVAVETVGGYTGFYTAMPLPTVGRVGAELIGVPPSTAPAEAYVALSDSNNHGYGFSVYDGTLHTYYNNGMPFTRTSEPYDPMAHRWLRIGFDMDQGTIEWETSPDASEWQLVDEELAIDVAFVIESADLEIGAGAWDGPVSADPLGAFGHAFVCDE
jgi:hypothetical protein